jgi:hypothetical protein
VLDRDQHDAVVGQDGERRVAALPRRVLDARARRRGRPLEADRRRPAPRRLVVAAAEARATAAALLRRARRERQRRGPDDEREPEQTRRRRAPHHFRSTKIGLDQTVLPSTWIARA